MITGDHSGSVTYELYMMASVENEWSELIAFHLVDWILNMEADETISWDFNSLLPDGSVVSDSTTLEFELGENLFDNYGINSGVLSLTSISDSFPGRQYAIIQIPYTHDSVDRTLSVMVELTAMQFE